jgi:hypothetical protein
MLISNRGVLAALLGFTSVGLHAEVFVAPSGGTLYMKCVGGSAGASSQVGTGTSIATFVAILSSLPQSCPTSEVSIGAVTAGQVVPFGIHTSWSGSDYWAFSTGTDQASLVSFTDMGNSLGMGGKISQPTGPNTWVLHLNDAAHYTISTSEANNILVQLRLSPAPAISGGTCSTQTLSGSYTYSVSGYYFDQQSNEYGFAAAGLIVLDGNGGFTGTDTVSDGAVITRGRQLSGVYTVNANCTGSLTLVAPNGNTLGHLDLVITNNARNVNFIQADNGTAITGTAQQQFPPQ